ncbi:MAG TPA: helix-turn-helix transcriptional regulator [Kofleriaceae bacterium]|nr:helix-turn-helix transcriptional regulator [Kofleriaceae bacterium]
MSASRLGRLRSSSVSQVGGLLQGWRQARRLSQLALANQAGISPRHLCFVETGRANPSREMVLTLAGVLDVPLRERNALLLAAGFAPMYRESGIADAELEPVRAALTAILRQQEPFPAVVLNRRWDVLQQNAAAERFFGWLIGPRAAPAGPRNVLRMMFDPARLRPLVGNWQAVAESLIVRARREAVGGMADPDTAALIDEILAYPGVPPDVRRPRLDAPSLPIIPISFEKDSIRFRYFSTVTTLGTPQDVTLQELRIECFFPADAATERNARELAATATVRAGPRPRRARARSPRSG